MNEELIQEMIAYIVSSQEEIGCEWGENEDFNELLKKGEVPELYYKLVKLLA